MLKRREKSALDRFVSNDFPDCEIFPYGVVLHDSDAVQPYLWGATDKQMTYLLEEGIEVFIKINIELLLD